MGIRARYCSKSKKVMRYANLAQMAGFNVAIPVPVSYYSFGGWKASLFGDTHIYGPGGARFYTRAEVVTARRPIPPSTNPTIDQGAFTCLSNERP